MNKSELPLKRWTGLRVALGRGVPLSGFLQGVVHLLSLKNLQGTGFEPSLILSPEIRIALRSDSWL